MLDEQLGVSLTALLFQRLQPLSKLEQIANIADGIVVMSNWEVHYWLAKVSNGRKRPALKAMRVLLGD
ncbi:MAG: hypothetical protein MJA27_23600 [Pseudanabaenales cyanobacterium]|nr:hypothetical protein [Pseudanabaenales cyanobacterium]